MLLYAESWANLPAAFPFRKERIVIGREPGVDLELEVPAVSRKHAEIGWANGAYHVRDLGSRNGVIVNGDACRARLSTTATRYASATRSSSSWSATPSTTPATASTAR